MTTLITPADRIFVAGHRGMAGSAICRALQRAGYGDPAQGGALLTATREELDLLNPVAVHGWFELMRPTVVVLAAAKVGGIDQAGEVGLGLMHIHDALWHSAHGQP